MNNDDRGVELRICSHCGASNAPHRCARCRLARYCDATCQREAWLTHRPECRRRRETSVHAGTSSVCARCLAFDRSKCPAELTTRFVVVGTETLSDNYFDAHDGRGRHTVKERGVLRQRTKCACRGCAKVWWCFLSTDPDGVFEATVLWTDAPEGFRTWNVN